MKNLPTNHPYLLQLPPHLPPNQSTLAADHRLKRSDHRADILAYGETLDLLSHALPGNHHVRAGPRMPVREMTLGVGTMVDPVEACVMLGTVGM